jgi:hypothetical protein
VNRAQTEAENRKETAVSTPTTKKEEKPVKPESKPREEVIGKGTNESAIKREEKSVTPETKVREEAIQKESSPSSEKEKDQN